MQTPAAPKKQRKTPATGGKGKQPMKRQKLQFNDDEPTGDEDAAEDQSSLGKHHSLSNVIHLISICMQTLQGNE